MASGYGTSGRQIKKWYDDLAEYLICLICLSLVKLQVRRYPLRPLLLLFLFLCFFDLFFGFFGGLFSGLDHCIGFGFYPV